MSELGSQKDYWNSRAKDWASYDSPLIPNDAEIHFIKNNMVLGGDSLILGATSQLCSMALDVSDTVTAVDYAVEVIEVLRIGDVNYECIDWNEFFKASNRKFDNILTDGGLLCLAFPESWREIAGHIWNHLKPNGIFGARVYLSNDIPPKETYQNPNLARFVSGIADIDENFMLQVSTNDEYRRYDVHYAFPPDGEVTETFNPLRLLEKFVPDYEEGARFVSYIWQKPAT